MTNIIIFGTGNGAEKILIELNEQVNIKCFIDNDIKKIGAKFHNLPILSAEYIEEVNYDYIIIASQYYDDISKQLKSIGVEDAKILEYFKYSNDMKFKYEFEFLLNKFKSNDNLLQILIFGMSFSRDGIDVTKLDRNAFNFSGSSQDLYYNFTILKFLFLNYESKLKNLKYVIIELPYFIFEYDLSRSLKHRNFVFKYKSLNDYHHLDKTIIYKMKNIEKILKIKYTVYRRKNLDSLINKDKKVLEVNGKMIADLYCSKNYSKTVDENKNIFKEFLKFARDKDLKVIAYTPPHSTYYKKNFSEKIRGEFFNILKSESIVNSVSHIDFYNCDYFKDEDFYDVIHLNRQGGKKLINYINRFIYSLDL